MHVGWEIGPRFTKRNSRKGSSWTLKTTCCSTRGLGKQIHVEKHPVATRESSVPVSRWPSSLQCLSPRGLSVMAPEHVKALGSWPCPSVKADYQLPTSKVTETLHTGTLGSLSFVSHFFSSYPKEMDKNVDLSTQPLVTHHTYEIPNRELSTTFLMSVCGKWLVQEEGDSLTSVEKHIAFRIVRVLKTLGKVKIPYLTEQG